MENNPHIKDQMTPEAFAVWVKKKREQREILYDMAEKQIKIVFETPAALNKHLKLQAQFGKMSVTNLLLVGAQMPEAKELRTYDEWQKRGRNINKGEKAILLLHAQGEYTREDGSTARGFDAKSVFDVTQTYGRELRSRSYPPAKAVVKAMLTKPVIPIAWVDYVKDARYHSNANQIEANRRLDADSLLYAVAREYAIADGADLFVAECAAAICCYRYSMMPESFDYDFVAFQGKDTRELKELLADARELACNFCDAIDKNLLKQHERSQGER